MCVHLFNLDADIKREAILQLKTPGWCAPAALVAATMKLAL